METNSRLCNCNCAIIKCVPVLFEQVHRPPSMHFCPSESCSSPNMLARRVLPSLSALGQVRSLSTRMSSVPIVNQAIQNVVPTSTCLVQHPYKLEGYRAPGAVVVERDLFAVVDHSGTQYKIVQVCLTVVCSVLPLSNSVSCIYRTTLLPLILWKNMRLVK